MWRAWDSGAGDITVPLCVSVVVAAVYAAGRDWALTVMSSAVLSGRVQMRISAADD